MLLQKVLNVVVSAKVKGGFCHGPWATSYKA